MHTDEYPSSRTHEEEISAKGHRASTIVEYRYDEIIAEVPVVKKQAVPHIGTVNHLRTYPFALETHNADNESAGKDPKRGRRRPRLKKYQP